MRVAAVIFSLAVTSSPAQADVFMFRMPSGNVVCSVGLEADSSDIVCTIFDRSGPPARPTPADCMSYWGHVFTMRDTGSVEMVCSDFDARLGKTVRDVAKYGVTGNFGRITCLSQESGLECRNASGHGFKLSRARQVVF